MKIRDLIEVLIMKKRNLLAHCLLSTVVVSTSMIFNIAYADSLHVKDYNGQDVSIAKDQVSSTTRFEDNVTVYTKDGNQYQFQFANQQRSEQAQDEMNQQLGNNQGEVIE